MSEILLPGPQGWGEKYQTVEQRLDTEKRQFDALAELVPQRMMARDPKPVNEELMKAVRLLHEANGIEGGFCFLYLWQAVFREQANWLRQLIGSCVASGDMRTTAYRMVTECFLLNDPEQLPGHTITGPENIAFFAPYSYRAGRREAGINGSGDGSTCMGQIKGKFKYGHLPCNTPGLVADAFPEPQSESHYRQWGRDNTLLDKWSIIGKKYMLLESSAIESPEDAKVAITEGFKPANICSGWGFAPDYAHPTWKDAEGKPVWIWKRSGSWAHNMSVIGWVVVNGKIFVIIENSWGDYHKNRKWFAIGIDLFEDWLRAAQCQTVGEIDMTDNGPAFPQE